MQVEFYFSDINLATTDQLFRFMSKDPEGYGEDFLSIVYSIGSVELSSLMWRFEMSTCAASVNWNYMWSGNMVPGGVLIITINWFGFFVKPV